MQNCPSSNGWVSERWELELEEAWTSSDLSIIRRAGAKGRIEREKLYLNVSNGANFVKKIKKSNGANDKVIKTSRGCKQLDILRLALNCGYKVDLCLSSH